MLLTSLTRYRDHGLLLLRIGLGAAFVAHGVPKLLGGPEVWAKLGKAMAHVGIDVFPVFWGFMAAASEGVGGILLALGLAFRPVTVLLALTMTVAAAMHIGTAAPGAWFKEAAHPLELAVVFYSLILIGPGRFSLDKN
jgi:putative oxidoreductase